MLSCFFGLEASNVRVLCCGPLMCMYRPWGFIIMFLYLTVWRWWNDGVAREVDGVFISALGFELIGSCGHGRRRGRYGDITCPAAGGISDMTMLGVGVGVMVGIVVVGVVMLVGLLLRLVLSSSWKGSFGVLDLEGGPVH